MAASELTADDVRNGYQLVLGRTVESDDVIAGHMKAHKDRESFWSALLTSNEFAGKRDSIMTQVGIALYSDGGHIEHDVTPEQLQVLVNRIREQWTMLGETEPHWSVLTSDKYRANQLDEAALMDFHNSGGEMLDLLEVFERRTRMSAGRGVCLELGCGTGRITSHLARRFERVIAVDISPGNLRLCEEHMKAQAIDNVETRLVSDPADFERFPPIDFFFSVIVLQHNSPADPEIPAGQDSWAHPSGRRGPVPDSDDDAGLPLQHRRLSGGQSPGHGDAQPADPGGVEAYL
ncbi:MAG: hypothetical protein B7Y86_10355 [Brevundimonas subvibrioides]|uniref:Methyltransferase domain-containing protein n=1 Tax=Brevundimonas subvibrioides TaxID=74313 RepID=A0A258HIA3_9CAUL|nr:class I SAM-dependent methyltransferase [Brevundimonas subvibrioides]OYX56337.1 MAG: hypothetical protein B7Y86_10355 [Brevundimonas subvibrioides]